MLSLIVAMSENDVIGRDGDMPWRISDDLRRFKKITMGHPILMGRKTYDSIGRPLPGRTSIVISRSAIYDDAQVRVARSLEQALDVATEVEEIFITGGAQIFALALPLRWTLAPRIGRRSQTRRKQERQSRIGAT